MQLSPVLFPKERAKDRVITVLACMLFVVPAMGVPHERILQDTLKSAIVAFGVLLAALLFAYQGRKSIGTWRWHSLLWLPLMLMVYALGSMVWSHTYLAGVEAMRWFVFALFMCLGCQVFCRERLLPLAEGIHAGAFMAGLWAALQFWCDASFFPQISHPASTFINRNFFAELAVCSVPFSGYLLLRSKNAAYVTCMAFSLGFNLVVLMMTGTRSALVALGVLLLLVLPIVAWRYRQQFALLGPQAVWQRRWACCVLLGTIAVLGVIPTGDSLIAAENRGLTPIERAFHRARSISLTDTSVNIRFDLWRASLRMVAAHPVAGVGAGAWEVHVVPFQDAGSQLELDYYAHNEFLQLLAEYGLVGWAFVLLLLGYCVLAAYKTIRDQSEEGRRQAPLRAVALASLLALFSVSALGFPWHLAGTGAMFALCLGLLAASDARLSWRYGRWGSSEWICTPKQRVGVLIALLACLALGIYITTLAVICEKKLVRATQLGMAITQSKQGNDPKWQYVKREMLTLVREGIAINPHYRKLTPRVADELASWGDWGNATWIWESVVASRPYAVALLANVARGHLRQGDVNLALEFFTRAQRLQPQSPAVRTIDVMLLARMGNEQEAATRAKAYLLAGTREYDLVDLAVVLGMRTGDDDFAIEALKLRNQNWPERQVDGWLKIGHIYAQKNDDAHALQAYSSALAATLPAARADVLASIEPRYRKGL